MYKLSEAADEDIAQYIRGPVTVVLDISINDHNRRMPGSSVFNTLDPGMRRNDELIRGSLNFRVGSKLAA